MTESGSLAVLTCNEVAPRPSSTGSLPPAGKQAYAQGTNPCRVRNDLQRDRLSTLGQKFVGKSHVRLGAFGPHREKERTRALWERALFTVSA